MPVSYTEIKLIICAIFILGVAGFSAWATHRIDQSHYLKLEQAITEAHNKALTQALAKAHEIDDLKEKEASNAIEKQREITKATQARLNEVQKYIKSHGCVTIGTIRLYNAAISGRSAAEVPIPSGKSDESCSRFGADEFARSIIKNIGIAKSNAQQLNDLEQSIKELNKATN